MAGVLILLLQIAVILLLNFPAKKSATEIDIANYVMVAASKKFTKQLYADHRN